MSPDAAAVSRHRLTGSRFRHRKIGEVWLTRGNLSAVPSSSPIEPVLTVAGTATQIATGLLFPFTGTVTIESNYQTTGASAGGDPICKKRTRLADSGAGHDPGRPGGCSCASILAVSSSASISALVPAGQTAGIYQFVDDPDAAGYSPTGAVLYGNLHSTGPYSFSWTTDL